MEHPYEATVKHRLDDLQAKKNVESLLEEKFAAEAESKALREQVRGLEESLDTERFNCRNAMSLYDNAKQIMRELETDIGKNAAAMAAVHRKQVAALETRLLRKSEELEGMSGAYRSACQHLIEARRPLHSPAALALAEAVDELQLDNKDAWRELSEPLAAFRAEQKQGEWVKEKKQMVRAKFRCDSVEQNINDVEGVSNIRMSAVTGYDTGSGPDGENAMFFRYTPSGHLSLGCVNPDATSQFEAGKEYYLDFNAVEQCAKAGPVVAIGGSADAAGQG